MREIVRQTLLAGMVLLPACSRSGAQAERSDAVAPATIEAATTAVIAGQKAFGAPCVVDAECAGAVCFHKRARGEPAARETRDAGDEAVEHDGYCSLRCRDDAECPVPPTRGKCGARGMCKRPG
jgi:hypothetical protein